MKTGRTTEQTISQGAKVHLLTSSQAALMLQVHESSIKRWCNASELSFQKTRGGHRRFLLEDLAKFSKDKNLFFPFKIFADDQMKLCDALLDYWQKKSLRSFTSVAKDWFHEQERLELLPELVGELYSIFEVPITVLCDELICGIMFETGLAWEKGFIRVGEEHMISQNMMAALFRLLEAIQEKRNASENHDSTESTPVVAVTGCSEGCFHEVGAFCSRLVLLELGWRVLHLGANVPITEFAAMQLKHKAGLVCISFVAPMRIADLFRTHASLAEKYDKEAPYMLVVGGGAISDLSEEENPLLGSDKDKVEPPECVIFKSFSEFDSWLQAKFSDREASTQSGVLQ